MVPESHLMTILFVPARPSKRTLEAEDPDGIKYD